MATGFFGLRELEFLTLQIDALFLKRQLFAPVLLANGFFANGLEVAESAAEGAFRLRLVTVEEVELIEIVGGPLGDVGFLLVKAEFIGGLDADAAVEEPAGVRGVVDEGRVLLIGRLVVGEVLVEEAVEIVGIFAGEEEGLRSAAVGESVQSGIVVLSHGKCLFPGSRMSYGAMRREEICGVSY